MTDPYADTLARIRARIKAIDEWKASLGEGGPPSEPENVVADLLEDHEIEALTRRFFQGTGDYQI